MKIEEISKKIFEIRKALGYTTKDQRREGWKEQMKSTKYLIEHAKKLGLNECVECGGFRYIKRKKFVKIEPDFNFRAK